MELTEGSETSAYINQAPGNYPKGNLLHPVHVSNLVGSSLGRQLCIQFGMLYMHQCEQSGGSEDVFSLDAISYPPTRSET